jgi:uncharacterized membrane protein
LKKESLIPIVTKISTCWKQIRELAERSLKSNWGFPFIIEISMLLFAAVVLLAVGWIQEAEITTTCAYFVLIAGTFLQLVCFEKNRFNSGVVFDGSG